MRLLKFKFKNLFSLGEGELNLSNRGLSLVTGYSEDECSSNGAGKSSLANKAIVWTLFGQTVGGLKADSVLNRHGKRKCFGEIEFEGKDGDIYRIRRERPAKLSIFKGTANVSGHTAKISQELVTKALGFDFNTFVQTSCFGQGRNVHYPSLTPKDQKAVLEQILPMEEVDRWAITADTELKSLKPLIDKVFSEYQVALGKVEALTGELGRAHEAGKAFESNRLLKRQSAQKALEAIDQEFSPRITQLAELKMKIEDADIEVLREKISIIESKLLTVESAYDTINTQLRNAINSRTEWTSRKRGLETQLSNLNKDTACPVCKRDYDDSTKKAVTDTTNELMRQISDCESKITECAVADTYYQTACNENLERQHNFKRQIAGKEDLIRTVQSYAEQEARLNSDRQAREASARALLETANSEENPHAATVNRLGADIKNSSQILDKALSTHKELNNELEHLKYWRDVYGKEMKLKLFEDACPFLDNRTEYHLERLLNKQIHCEFSTVKRLANGKSKEEFSVNVWSETGGQGFESLSGGEQQMVSFAIGLALADLASSVAGAESGFLILDEPFTELDERNGEAVVEYLTTEVENGRDTVLLISNDEALKGLIADRIHVVKSKGVSNVKIQ